MPASASSLEGERAHKGVFITTSYFTRDVEEYVKKIVLIDGERLAEYMIRFGVGVADVTTYTIKRIDGDYFEEE